MKILFLSTHLNTGGITSYMFILAKGLIGQGHSVHIATSGGNSEEEFLSMGVKLFRINIRTKSELSPRIYMALFSLTKYINANQIEIIHSHTRITQVMGKLLGFLSHRPYVSTCHGFFKTRWSRKSFPCWGDRVIAISPAVEEHLVNAFGVNQEKITLIENGIDLDQFSSSAAGIEAKRDGLKKLEMRKEYRLGDVPVIGIIARLSDVKGQDILIKAMKKITKKFPEARLLIVGRGKFEDTLKYMVEVLNLNNHVLFYPHLNRTIEILSILDIFVMPSRQEGLGISVMEAQSAGLPVVASNVGGLPGLIIHGHTGLLVEPENIDELADAIIVLLMDKTRAQKIGQAARHYAHQNYSADKMVEKTEALYKGTLVKLY